MTVRKHSFGNREEIKRSSICGCYGCCSIYPATVTFVWHYEMRTTGQYTAFCPKCGIDSVIGNTSGFEITTEVLKQMQNIF